MEETDQQQKGEPTRGLLNESRKESENSNTREDGSEKTWNHRAEEESSKLTNNCNKGPADNREVDQKAMELTASQTPEERSELAANRLEDDTEKTRNHRAEEESSKLTNNCNKGIADDSEVDQKATELTASQSPEERSEQAANRLEVKRKLSAEVPRAAHLSRRLSHRVTTYVTVPPDGGWGWVIVFASFMCSFVVDGIVFSFGVFLNEMSRDLGASKSEVTIAGALLSGFYLIAGPFVSAIANRYGFRLTGIVGSIIGSLAFVAASMAQNIETLWLVYGFIGGIGFGMIYVPSVITTGFYFEKWRALATGIAVTGSGVGTIIVAPLTTLLIERFTWRGALLIQAGAVLNCAVFSSLYRPLKPVQVSVTGDPEEGSEDEDKPKMPLLHRIKMARDELRKADSTLSIDNEVEIIAVQPLETNKFLKANNNVYYPTAAEALTGQSIGDEDICSSFDSLNKKKMLNRSNGFFKRNTTDNRTIVYSEKRPSLVYSKKIIRTKKEDEYDPVKDFTADEALLTEHIHDDVLYVPKKQKQSGVGDRRDSFTVRYRSRSQSDSSTKSARSRRNTLTSKMEAGVRPLYRDDIFFQASLHRLPQYQSHGSGLDYTMSVSRLPTWKDVQEEEEASCQMFPEAVRRTLATMLDTSLLGSPSFMLLAVAGFTFTLGLFTPFMFLPDRALLNGMDPGLTMFLLSSIGVTNTLGRILSGLITSLPGVSSLALNNIALTVGGTATILSGLSNTPLYQFTFTAIFGLAISFFVSLRSIIVVELIGLEKLTNAFGLLLLFQGLAAAIGSPIAGVVMDATGNYDIPFYISGGLILLSGVMCYPLGCLKAWEDRRNQRQKEQIV